MRLPFTVAILADIHGNLRALEAVLSDVAQHQPSEVVFAGDLVMNGPQPAEVLAAVKELGHPAVMGNTDAEVIAGTDPVAQWTRANLDAKDLVYLRALPLSHRITPPHGTSLDDDLLIVHATPRSCYDVLILKPHPLGTTFTQPTPAEEATHMLAGERANLIVFGHIHYASSGIIGTQKLESVGAVGFLFDGDRRAAYVLATWDGKDWQLEQHRVSYDVESIAEDLERSGVPFASRYAKMLQEAIWLPRP